METALASIDHAALCCSLFFFFTFLFFLPSPARPPRHRCSLGAGAMAALGAGARLVLPRRGPGGGAPTPEATLACLTVTMHPGGQRPRRREADSAGQLGARREGGGGHALGPFSAQHLLTSAPFPLHLSLLLPCHCPSAAPGRRRAVHRPFGRHAHPQGTRGELFLLFCTRGSGGGGAGGAGGAGGGSFVVAGCRSGGGGGGVGGGGTKRTPGPKTPKATAGRGGAPPGRPGGR